MILEIFKDTALRREQKIIPRLSSKTNQETIFVQVYSSVLRRFKPWSVARHSMEDEAFVLSIAICKASTSIYFLACKYRCFSQRFDT